ncbi:MAG: type II toxin-antitoxin system HipA family toxin [bacterium]|nr:type II toxin-antitoxin system HipA family toxin [bacterium]MDE0241730.1 type II toxin-antitoxin system HipA family toxin [bacterium]MDE0417385.1 type II toxin-antitoxin system HipA family toxin [bacterium]
MTEPLVVIADRRIMGEIRRDRRGRLTFVYDDLWRSMDTAYPLSLSMPIVAAEHEHARIEPWLWGLLPDNQFVLARWGQRFHVSPRNVFALLGAVGEDCPGAIQLVRPNRVDDVMRGDGEQIDWLTEGDVAERLRILRNDQAAWRMPRDTGQFSLAGAQPKTALIFDGERWGVPYGSVPTTHILKPPLDGLDGHTANEHLCLALARALGLPAARSKVRRFEDESAIIVERYDRQRRDGSIRRLHQEDMCQVLGLPPTRKYQNEGGPGCAELSEAIRTHSGVPGDDAWTFACAIMLNWIIGGTDAHAKNFSMLIGASGRARLAPLYDMASTLPYGFDPMKLKMATKIGGKYRLEEVLSRHWARFATQVSLPPADVLAMGKTMAETVPAAFDKTVADARAGGLDHPILQRMTDLVNARSKYCARILEAPTG